VSEPQLLLARVSGTTADAAALDADLTARFTQMQHAATAAGATLEGVDLWSPDAEW
jgi:hypothetical protein